MRWAGSLKDKKLTMPTLDATRLQNAYVGHKPKKLHSEIDCPNCPCLPSTNALLLLMAHIPPEKRKITRGIFFLANPHHNLSIQHKTCFSYNAKHLFANPVVVSVGYEGKLVIWSGILYWTSHSCTSYFALLGHVPNNFFLKKIYIYF